MTEREQDTEEAKQEAATGDRGEEQEPKQADSEESSTFWDTEQHSDSPGPFGTGDEQTQAEAAGNPEAENSGDDDEAT
ncbi:MAG: hypothetical protein M3350_04890 [Actinomycetota bacterium]|nr:hypothetical protein [Actinomycetota bacterium]MDQ3720106.1 hypothetical protein [Actinomycetota bacterium]